MEAQLEVVRIAPTFFAHLATNVMLSWCLFTKISASELSRKFIKSALSVGKVFTCKTGFFFCVCEWVHPVSKVSKGRRKETTIGRRTN